jgi:hypothetical protein
MRYVVVVFVFVCALFLEWHTREPVLKLTGVSLTSKSEKISSNAKRNGTKFITQFGRDGVGHQLLGMFSCMLLPFVNEDWTYVKKESLGAEGHEKSVYDVALFEILQQNAPKRKVDAVVIEKDNCAGELRSICKIDEATRDDFRRCNRSKRTLAQHWRRALDGAVHLKPVSHGVLIHIRGGDRPEHLDHGSDVIPWITKFMLEMSTQNTVTISVETEDDKTHVESHLTHKIRHESPGVVIDFLVGGDPVQVWLRMVYAELLLMGRSSFSVSAALARTKPTFTIDRQGWPIDGRYDWNSFPCQVDLVKRYGIKDLDTSINSTIVAHYSPRHGADKDECVSAKWTSTKAG